MLNNQLLDANFKLFVELVIKAEIGKSKDGWVNNPGDLGKMTMWGISSAAHPELATAIKNRTLTKAKACTVYYNDYYANIPHLNALDPRLAFFLFDAKVHGAFTPVKFIQNWLNAKFEMSLAADGQLGPKTCLVLSKMHLNETEELLTAIKTSSNELAKTAANIVLTKQKQKGLPRVDYTNGFKNRYNARIDHAISFLERSVNV